MNSESLPSARTSVKYPFNIMHFDKIRQTELGVYGEVRFTDALTKLDEVSVVLFEGKTYNIATRFDWLYYFHRIAYVRVSLGVFHLTFQ